MQPNQPLNQPVMPTTPTPFSPGGPGRGGISPLLILVVVLGLGALVFAVLTIMFYSQARTATTTLESQKSAAVAKAKAEQKEEDDAANTAANESPFRSYVAPVEYGSFEIKFPKNWSAQVEQQKSGTQVSLALNPDFIRRTNSTDELQATHVNLIERTSDQFMTQYNSLVQRGTLKKSDITVSGLKAFNVTGTFQDKRTTRMVVVPVRDKVLVFLNENSRYASEFNEILAQSKIIP